jgi:hypothetical protein
VGYVYRIGKYEVTNTQNVEFLNAVTASDPSSFASAAAPATPARPDVA